MSRVYNSSSNLRYALYVLVFLAAQTFFNPFGIVSGPMGKLYFGVFSALALAYAWAYGLNLKRVEYPKMAYRLLIVGILFSIVMVEAFQRQSLMITVIATMPSILGYLFFYTLMKLNIPPKRIEKTLMWLTVASAIMYLANLFAFPDRIFGEEKDEVDMSRGFMRLGMPMIVTVVTYFFYSINRWLIEGKSKWLWWIALTAVMIVMSLTRQVILISFVLGGFYIMRRAAMWKRILVLLFVAVSYFLVLPNIPIYSAMLELSENQYERNSGGDEDIRITAWRFYTTEYQTNNWTYFFGNGVPSHGKSPWGIRDEYTVYPQLGGNGCFRVDVGWAGFFWYFGAFATLGLLLLMLGGVMRDKSPDKEYLTYALIYVMLTAIASGPILFPRQIIELCVLLYLVFSRQNVTYETNRNSNSQLQQLRGYHQLY